MKRDSLAIGLAAAALPLAAFALYASGLQYPLVFDDFQIRTAFGNRELTGASFQGIEALLGRDLAWQRLGNILLHGTTGLALFGFLSRLFEVVLGDARGRWTALLGSLAFVLHPVAVYGVAYLVQRSILLATLFSVLALWCVLEGLLRRSTRWHMAATVAYALAVLSKEHALMVPAVAAALVVLLQGVSRESLRNVALVTAMQGAVALLTVYRLRSLIGAAYEPFTEVIGAASLPLSMVNQAYLYFRYLLTWLVPCPCWMSIDLRVAFPDALLAWPQTAGAIAYLAYPFAAGALLLRGGHIGLLGFGLLYPWLLGITEMVVVRAQEPFVLYRSYLWMSGLPAILPAMAPGVRPLWRNTALAVICVALVALAKERLATFSSPLGLWNDAVTKNTDPRAGFRERALINRGELLRGAGRPQAALADFNRAIEINPRQASGYISRATVYLESGRTAEALADLDRALELDARRASAYAKRCYAKVVLGQPRAGALADCDRALELNPSDAELRAIADWARKR